MKICIVDRRHNRPVKIVIIVGPSGNDIRIGVYFTDSKAIVSVDIGFKKSTILGVDYIQNTDKR